MLGAQSAAQSQSSKNAVMGEEGFFGSGAEKKNRFNPVSGIQLAKNHPLLPPAEIIVAFIWADLHNGDAPQC